MSTHDVPGAKASNLDVLKMGCWAEHEDGSLILVESTEGKRVIYSVFDTTASPIIEYRDAMPEDGFKKHFSWDDKNKSSIKWTWHDRTPFPWDQIIQSGGKDGPRFASADDQISAAEKVATSRDLTRGKVRKDALHRLRKQWEDNKEVVIRRSGGLRDKLQRVINEIRT